MDEGSIDMTEATSSAEAVAIPLQGHWDDPDPQMVAEYATRDRSDLMRGDMTDFALANRQFMAGRSDLDLVAWQTAAKERIRWLSVQLALTRPPRTISDQDRLADLLTKAVGDIFAALTMAGKQDKIAAWTKPYVDALNEYDTRPPAAPSSSVVEAAERLFDFANERILQPQPKAKQDFADPENYWHRAALAAMPALSDQEKLEGWQPIETAPKDGTTIDVWRDGSREMVSWGFRPHECGEMGQYCDSDWHSEKEPGWVCSTFGEFVGGKHDPFTHWMPLPAGPITSARQTGEPS